MPSGEVTKRNVDALKPGATDIYLWDDGGREGPVKGFGAKITPKGVVSFVYQYRMGGRESTARRIRIGGYGEVTPAQARERAKELARQVLSGNDPLEAKRRARREAVDLAFPSYVERFTEDYLKTSWVGSWNDASAALKRYAVPVLRDIPINKIVRADIHRVLAPIRGKAATARNLFAVLRRMFTWAVSQGDLADTPMRGVTPPPLPPSRNRVLADRELRIIWLASAKLGYPFGPLYRLLILSGQRLEEVAALDWAELARGDGLWTLPAARAKNGVSHLVPLNAAAIDVLDDIARSLIGKGWPRGGLVFSTNGETSVSGYSKAKKRLDQEASNLIAKEAVAAGRLEIPVAPWRIHDLRRTVATGLQRLHVRFEVTEAVLNHVSGAKSGVAGVYQRHDWKEEKIAALALWGAHVTALGVEQTPD